MTKSSEVSSQRSYATLLFVIFAGAILVRLLCFSGLIGSDDLTYNRKAYALATHTFSVEPAHRETRVGLILPVSALFQMFGLNELSSAIVPFASFMLTFWVIVSMATSFWGRWTGITAGLLYTFLPIEMYYATILLPDLPSSACIAFSGMLVYQSEQPTTINNESSKIVLPPWIISIIAGIALGWAFLIRETAVFFGVFVAGYMLYLSWRDRAIRLNRCLFWVGLFAVIGVEMGFYWHLTGNPLYRYMAIEHAHTGNAVEQLEKFLYVPIPIYVVLDRLRALFLTSDFGFQYFFVLAGLLYGFRKRISHWGYVAGWFCTVYALYSFGSTSVRYYAPMRTVPRYFFALSVPAILILAKFFVETSQLLLQSDKKSLRRFLLACAVPGIIMLLLTALWFSLIKVIFLTGLLLTCGFLATRGTRTWIQQKIPVQYAPAIVPTFLLYISILPGVYTLTKPDAMRNRLAQERELLQVFESPLQHRIYTDPRTEEVLEYLYHYQHDDDILEFADAAVDTLENTYVVANWERLFFLNHLYAAQIPDFLYTPPPQWILFAQIGDEINPCLIYYIPQRQE